MEREDLIWPVSRMAAHDEDSSVDVSFLVVMLESLVCSTSRRSVTGL